MESMPEAPLLTWVISFAPRRVEDLVTGLFPTLLTHWTAPDPFLQSVLYKPDALLRSMLCLWRELVDKCELRIELIVKYTSDSLMKNMTCVCLIATI